MSRSSAVLRLALPALVAACGPDAPPEQPCPGPTFDLVIRPAEGGALPQELELYVRYGGKDTGERYTLGEKHTPQVVFCSPSGGGAAARDCTGSPAGAAGEASGGAASDADALVCCLYTQGPAHVTLTAEGYTTLERNLDLDDERCRVAVELELTPLEPASDP